MKAIVLCLIALVVVSNATSLFDQYPLNFKKSRSFMTLLTQVEAKLKAGGPLDAITKMLNDFKSEIVDEQVQHDNLWERQQAECAGEKEFREKEISDATGARNAAQETLDGCNSQQARARADLAITKTQLSENLEYLVIIEALHKSDVESYEITKATYDLVKNAIEEAIVLVEEFLQGEESFAQIVKHTNNMVKLFSQINKMKLVTPAINALIQLKGLDPEDEQLFKRVQTVLRDLLEKTNDAFQQATEDFDAIMGDSAENYHRTKAVIANLEENQSGLEVEIATLDKCIVNQTGIVSSAQAKIDRNQQLLEDADNLCDAVQVQYEEATKQRKQELKLLQALRERCEARFADLSADVTARGEQDEFDAHSNESAYEHKSFN